MQLNVRSPSFTNQAQDIADFCIKQKVLLVQKCFPSYTTGGSEQQTDVQDAPSV